jgi:hypothetical protein
MSYLRDYVVPSQKLCARVLGRPYETCSWSVEMLCPQSARLLAEEVERHYGVYPLIVPQSLYGGPEGLDFQHVSGDGLDTANDPWKPHLLSECHTPVSCCLECGSIVHYECLECGRES